MVAELAETWSTETAPRSIVFKSGKLHFQPDKAVALGIVVNELVSNACKYAYGSTSPGEVRVTLRSIQSGEFCLAIEDDGCGPSSADSAQGTGLGSKIISAMAATLKAKVSIESGSPGLRAILKGPLH